MFEIESPMQFPHNISYETANYSLIFPRLEHKFTIVSEIGSSSNLTKNLSHLPRIWTQEEENRTTNRAKRIGEDMLRNNKNLLMKKIHLVIVPSHPYLNVMNNISPFSPLRLILELLPLYHGFSSHAWGLPQSTTPPS